LHELPEDEAFVQPRRSPGKNLKQVAKNTVNTGGFTLVWSFEDRYLDHRMGGVLGGTTHVHHIDMAWSGKWYKTVVLTKQPIGSQQCKKESSPILRHICFHVSAAEIHFLSICPPEIGQTSRFLRGEIPQKSHFSTFSRGENHHKTPITFQAAPRSRRQGLRSPREKSSIASSGKGDFHDLNGKLPSGKLT
jgi:hypothetical protein